MESNRAEHDQQPAAWICLPPHATRFPVRPLPAGRLLIGSGAECAVRLGDPSVPPRHSLLLLSAASAQLETLSDRFELIVNGTARRRAELHDGDLLEFGASRLIFRRILPQQDVSQPSPATHEPSADAPGGTPSLPPESEATQLTPGQFVLRLQAELELIQLHTHSTVDGLSELLHAAEQLRAADSAARTAGPHAALPDASAGDRLERELSQQESRIAAVERIVEQVVRQQQMMADALHTISERLAELSPTGVLHREPPRRASA